MRWPVAWVCLSWAGCQSLQETLALSGGVSAPRTHVSGIYQRTSVSARSPLFSLSGGSQDDDTTTIMDERKKVIIVGGGPVGLTAALTLSNYPHNYDVVVLEQTAKDTAVSQYDATKAYLYLVNPRGQTAFKNKFPSVLEKLQERGQANNMKNFVLVPGDPSEPLPKRQDDTKPQTSEMKSFADGQKKAGTTSKDSYWIPRHLMVQLLEEVIQEQQMERTKQRGKDSWGSIELRSGQAFKSMKPKDGLLEVTVQDTTSADVRYEKTFTASLVVGADGINSGVRNFLANDTQIPATQVPLATSPQMASWLTMEPQKFIPKKFVSPATGLRMRILQLPPRFSIPDADGSLVETEAKMSYGIRSICKGPFTRCSLGLLPGKDDTMVRPANIILRPNHELLKLKDGQSNKEWFAKAFPRMKFDKFVDDQEWERFATSEGTTFPCCQYSPGLQMASPDGEAGVVLIGDSTHSFPPDIGQGINAGLADVVALDRALIGEDMVTGKKRTTPANLGEALQEFERVRRPELKSLINLARCGAPYQYKQPLRIDRFRRSLWMANIAFRSILNKLSFGIVAPPAIMMLQDDNLTYRQLMRRADLTTAGLNAAFLAMMWALFGGIAKNVVKGLLS